MACGGTYSSVEDVAYTPDSPGLVAVGPDRYLEWPCGTPLWLCSRLAADNDGAGGLALDGSPGLPSLFCIAVVRTDSCPGCGAGTIDLSESGLAELCPGSGSCAVWIHPLR